MDLEEIVERKDLWALREFYRCRSCVQKEILCALSQAGWVEGVGFMLERVSDPNATLGRGQETALHHAAVGGKADVINLLLAQGRCSRSLAIKTTDGHTPLIMACARGNWDAAKAMLEHPYGPSRDVLQLRNEDGHSAFRLVLDAEIEDDADPAKRLAVADALRVRGADMGTQDVDGWTALHAAVRANNVASISYLVKHAPQLATVNDNTGKPPIAYLARYLADTIEPLLEEAAARGSAARPAPQQPAHDPLQWTFKQVEDACDKFAPAAVLGRGSFSVVYAGTGPNGRRVAIKTIDTVIYRAAKAGDKDAWATTFKNEIKLLRRLKHPNLVQLLGWAVDGGGSGRLAVVLERVNETLGARLFKVAGKAPLLPVDRLRIALGVARGLTYLHGQTEDVLTQGLQPMYHRDIKSQNIGLMADLTPKLLDYGLARVAAATNELTAGTIAVTGRIVGSVGYMPPEVTQGKYNARSEIYSYGMVLLELCTLRPCTAETPDAVEEATDDGANALGLRTLMAKPTEEWPGGSLPLLLTLVNDCVQRRPARRPRTMRHVLISLNAILRAVTQRDLPPPIRAPTVTPAMVDHLAAQLDAARIEAAAAAEETKAGEHVPAPATPRGLNELLLTCLICSDDVPATGGIACKAPAGHGRHFVCHPCLEGTLRCELGDRGDEAVRSHCSIRCPSWNAGCAAEPWGPADLVGKLSREANLFYLERVHEMYLHGVRREQARREEAARQEEQRRLDAVGFHHDRIADLLVLKCPSCGRGFTDVDGCNAVTCKGAGPGGREYGCGTVFCFVCFQVGTSTEVHAHMSSANHWIKGQELETFRRGRRIEAVSQYLRGLDEHLRRRVLEVSVPRTLRDVGIRAEDLRL